MFLSLQTGKTRLKSSYVLKLLSTILEDIAYPLLYFVINGLPVVASVVTVKSPLEINLELLVVTPDQTYRI